MARFGWRLRCSALLSASALSLHELRYLLAPAPGGDAAPAARHAYLALALPLATSALALLLAGALTELAGGHAEGERRRRWGRGRTWLGCATALAAVFFAQEALESLLTTGGAMPGVAEAFGGGGWIVAPLAAALGAVMSLLMHQPHRASAGVARIRFPARRAPAAGLAFAWRAPLRPNPLAAKLAGRGPPVGAR